MPSPSISPMKAVYSEGMVDASNGRLTAGVKGYTDTAYLSTLSALAGSLSVV
jgi:hypothetical protein